MERVVADADDLKDFAGVSGADLHGLAQVDVERLGDVCIDDDFSGCFGRSSFRMTFRHPNAVGVGASGYAVPE